MVEKKNLRMLYFMIMKLEQFINFHAQAVNDISYIITDGNELDVFTISESTGVITTKQDSTIYMKEHRLTFRP